MIYLDSAATTLQKPPEVYAAVANAMSHAASPGRGGHRWGREAARIAYTCREAAAELFHVPEPEQVIFTCNATHGLNLAIRTLVKPGSSVLISGYEHNAVTRPLHAIPNVEVRIASCRPFDSESLLCAFSEELRKGTDVVICTHVSNVFGYILPIEEISHLCKQAATPLIIDASQSAGCVPINFTALDSEFIAMPGHKGLYGPQGTGLLLCRSQAEPLLYGGTGSLSALQAMPDFLPDRLEAGTSNTPGIAGLLEGIKFVSRTGTDAIGRYESRLIRAAARQLDSIPKIHAYYADDPIRQSGVLSFTAEGLDCEQIGEWLGQHGIAVRAGLHCAPTAHQSADTLECGTVRISVSVFNTGMDINQFVNVMRKLTQSR